MFKKKPFVGVKVGIYKRKNSKKGPHGGILHMKIARLDLYGNEKYTGRSLTPDGLRLMYDKKTVFYVPADSLAYFEVCE